MRWPRSIPDECVIILVLLRRRGWNLTGQGSLLAQTPARRLCLLLIMDACILLRYIVAETYKTQESVSDSSAGLSEGRASKIEADLLGDEPTVHAQLGLL